MNFNQWTPEYFLANEASCLNALKEYWKNKNDWNKIPMLNYAKLDQLKDNQLVRFRGMIQDMQDPECYVKRYEVSNEREGSKRMVEGKFRDIIVLKNGEKVEQNSQVYGDRRPVFVVSIPGYNSWALDYEKKLYGNCNNSVEVTVNGQQSHNKRSLDEDEEMDVDERSKKPNLPVKHHKQNGESSSSTEAAENTVLSSEYHLNSPIPERPSKACLVKMYGKNAVDCVLNTIVDVIGFLSIDPALDGSTNDQFEDIDDATVQATNPPPSLIPRLHAIYIENLAHTNPLLYIDVMALPLPSNLATEIFTNIMNLLTQCLFGDKIAAEYLFCHLVSTVYIRTGLQSLGQFSLNLSNIPAEVLPEYTNLFYEITELLLPASHYYPMTLNNMNTHQFVPKKDYETNKLTSGLLQLAPHTHLVLDETRLHTGKLESNGLHAVASIAYLINQQKLIYDFQFYKLEFDTNVPILILSEGKSMLPNCCYCPIIPDTDSIRLIGETIKAGKHFIQPKLNEIRKFLTQMRMQEFNMSATDPVMIQNDFVKMRQDETVTADDLHQLLVLSRLLGLIRGKSALDMESWNHAKELEIERRNRVEMFVKRRNEM
uniref:Mini-chromosome maintenance complex-binding protein n=1 Tax=Corethrella appendiculata TaxID=1370023 RepID=U5EXQ7_9DIPT